MLCTVRDAFKRCLIECAGVALVRCAWRRCFVNLLLIASFRVQSIRVSNLHTHTHTNSKMGTTGVDVLVFMLSCRWNGTTPFIIWVTGMCSKSGNMTFFICIKVKFGVKCDALNYDVCQRNSNCLNKNIW